jgi:hypothetical protein
MDTYYKWSIENKTADTIKISFTNKTDSIIVRPHNQFGKIVNTDFSCAAGFEENTFTVTVSGNKKLVKQLHISDNWERSTHVRQLYCDQRKECTFVINPEDIE